MNFWHSISGMVEVELTSAEPETALESISEANVEIRNLHQISELTYSFWVLRKNCRKLEEICKRRGETLRYRRKLGVYWLLRRGLRRPVLLIGGSMILAIVLWLPSRVFFVDVDGNETISDRKILEAAENCGIGFGASRREVRSEKMKNALLAAVPELQWAGVNTSGCTATISVRERSEPETDMVPTEAASISASRDGFILSCTVTKGNPLVKPGDTVKEGQILISAYTDCGLCIRAERAEGEVLAQTSRELEAVTPMKYVQKGAMHDVKRKISLLLRKKRIFLWKDSGILDASCGRMYEEYYVTLPGGFRLPFALCVEQYFCGETSVQELTEAETGECLKVFAARYLSQQMVGGSIVHADQTVVPENGVYRLTGEYTCLEMIGKVRQEQIGDTNGKNS